MTWRSSSVKTGMRCYLCLNVCRAVTGEAGSDADGFCATLLPPFNTEGTAVSTRSAHSSIIFCGAAGACVTSRPIAVLIGSSDSFIAACNVARSSPKSPQRFSISPIFTPASESWFEVALHVAANTKWQQRSQTPTDACALSASRGAVRSNALCVHVGFSECATVGVG